MRNMQGLFRALIQGYELVRRQGTGPLQKEILSNFADWAAQGYIFAASAAGRIAAIGIAGPVTANTLNAKGAKVMPGDFDRAEGRRIYCAYALVDKKYRGRLGATLLAEMTKAARDSFPDCTSLVYARALRGDDRLREKPFKRDLIASEVEDDNGL